MQHGGVFHHYKRSNTTYTIASILPDVKVRSITSEIIIRPRVGGGLLGRGENSRLLPGYRPNQSSARKLENHSVRFRWLPEGSTHVLQHDRAVHTRHRGGQCLFGWHWREWQRNEPKRTVSFGCGPVRWTSTCARYRLLTCPALVRAPHTGCSR
ncbi:AGAP005939-PA-like protein [Anopheles sinensis]|uniref:AGAP005939-PA-like protein n=1 Tax=Anopheles sinensis TaxID=74873 RepID=A0A084VN54_ANOSI|nr:AGAP005939-PA-like protein [Anopheles sinensis]